MSNFPRLAAALVVLVATASIVGCPGTPTATEPSTKPTGTKTAKPTAAPSGTPTPKGTATATPTPAPTGTGTPGATTSPSTTATPTTGATTTATTTASATTGTVEYVQIERLGRPAINEGLIRDNALLNLWNSVGPDVDITPAAALITAEANATLLAFGNSQAEATFLTTQLLPDVMRIDTLRTSGYAQSFGQLTIDNLSSTKKIPLGGRMITDDVMDITLQLLVPGGLPDSTAVPGLESDGVSYATGHKPVLVDFPYLAAPN